MKARPATIEDLPECLRMGRAFAHAAKLDADDESLIGTLHLLLREGALFVTGDPVNGMVGGLAYPAYYNRSLCSAQELFWFVDPNARRSGAGQALFDALQEWAREKGAHTLTMVTLDDLDGERVADFYCSRGYRPLERNFMKVL